MSRKEAMYGNFRAVSQVGISYTKFVVVSDKIKGSIKDTTNCT